MGGSANGSTMKDQKIPIWAKRLSFESWLDDFTRLMTNVKYSDSHYVDRLMGMLKDCNTREDVVKFTVEDLLERRCQSRDSTEKILGILKERFGRTEREI